MKVRIKDITIIGFALFAMFFGAGNLIFPPQLGFNFGDDWFTAFLGFATTGIGIPMLATYAMIRHKGDFLQFSSPVSKVFSIIYGSAVVIALGPLLAIPRTSATTFELAVAPYFGQEAQLFSTLIFFGLTWALTYNPKKVVDIIGSILTPLILISMLIIIVSGIVNPIGESLVLDSINPLSKGLMEGYLTLDGIGAALMAMVVIASIKEMGYTETKDTKKVMVGAIVISTLGLGTIYGGLMYLGASAGSVFPTDISRTDLLLGIVNNILGTKAGLLLGVAVASACLTTAIGITTIVGRFFENISNGKLSYKFMVTACSIFSATLSMVGLESIIAIAVPILSILYPVTLILIILNLTGGIDRFTLASRVTIFFTLAYAILEIGVQNVSVLSGVETYLTSIPLYGIGFGWIMITVVAFFVGMTLEFGGKRLGLRPRLVKDAISEL